MADLSDKSILIVEDEEGPRNALEIILNPTFTVFTADNADSALQIMQDHPIDLVTLDLKLPGLHGQGLLQEIRKAKYDAEVIIITGYGSLESAIESIQQGIAGYVLKPFDVADVISTVHQALDRKYHLDCLRNFMKDFGNLWIQDQDTTKTAMRLAKLLGAKDTALCRHSRQTQHHASLLGQRLELCTEDHELLKTGALLHDIGTIGIDEHILSTQASLHGTEREIFTRHTEIGARMADSLGFHSEISSIIRHHHERFDGTGYPSGLGGEAIPLFARIVGIAHSYDHLVTGDTTSPARSPTDATTFIRQHAGTRYDPVLANIFVSTIM